MRRWHLALGVFVSAVVALAAAGTVGAQRGGERALFAVMSGEKEVDESGEPASGDPNGRGSFSATLDGRTLCYGIQVKNIGDPIAAHIHRGGRRTAGPVVQTLVHPESGDPGASSECVRVPRALAGDLRARPGRYYVNVHNVEYGAGAVRGQLFGRSR